MKAIGFDLGRTLVGDENMPLSWKSLYKEALIDALFKCNANVDDNKIAIGEEVLLKYNTRTNYREIEVSSDVIFSEIIVRWELNTEIYLATVKEAFFSYFQRNVKFYEDTTSTLKTLKERGIKIGILTDVPYGMDKNLVLADIKKFEEYVDIVLTSVEVDYRKPNKQGFIQLSKELVVDSNEMVYVGDEEKDIIGIGIEPLGEPDDYNDYVMLDTVNGCSELVVSSRQKGMICTDGDVEYIPQVRMYFDTHKIIEDGLGVRDGAHVLKIYESLPLEPYLKQIYFEKDIPYIKGRNSWTPTLFTEEAERIAAKPWKFTGTCKT